MTVPHILAAVLVAAIWGTNFVAIDILLRDVPPIFATVLRFFFASVPAIFFIRPPKSLDKNLATVSEKLGEICAFGKKSRETFSFALF